MFYCQFKEKDIEMKKLIINLEQKNADLKFICSNSIKTAKSKDVTIMNMKKKLVK